MASDGGASTLAHGHRDPFIQRCGSALLEKALFDARTHRQILVGVGALIPSDKSEQGWNIDMGPGHRTHMKEMQFLITFLQRPRCFYRNTIYEELLARLKNMHLERVLTEHLKHVYQSYVAYSAVVSPVVLDMLLHLISCYAEALLLYTKALDDAEGDEEAAERHGRMSDGMRPADLTFLYTFALEAGREDRGRAAQWGRSAVCVTVFLMHCAKAMLCGANRDLLQRCCDDFGRSEAPSTVSLVVPQCVLYCLAHPSDGDDGAVMGDFLQRASTAVTTTRVLDLYSNAFFRRDSAEFSIALNYVNDYLRETLHRFFHLVPNDLIATCHLDTLLGFGKSMAIHGPEWEEPPTALAALTVIARNNMVNLRVVMDHIKTVNTKVSEARFCASNADEAPSRRDHEALWMQTLGIEEASGNTGAALALKDSKNNNINANDLVLSGGGDTVLAGAAAATSSAVLGAGLFKALGCQFHTEVDYELYAYSLFNYVAAGGLRFLTSMASIEKYFTVDQKEVAVVVGAEQSNARECGKSFNVLNHSLALLEGYLSPERIQTLFGTVLDRHDPQHGSLICQAAFVESTVNLVLSMAFHCRTDLQGLSSFVGVDVLSYCKHVCRLFLAELSIGAFIQDRVYNFVALFSGGLGDLQGLADLLLQEELCALVGTNVEAVGTATAQMCVYAHLCSASEAVSKERIFLSLCRVQRGAIEQTLEGGTFFLLAAAHLQYVRSATFYAEHDLSTFVHEVLLSSASRETLSTFILRWCEGLSFLLKQLAIGVVTLCGESIHKHVKFVVEVLTIILLTTQAYKEMAQCSVRVLEVENTVTLFYALLALLFEGGGAALGCAEELTELLLILVHRTPEEELLYALRSSCTQEVRLTFAAKIRVVLQEHIGHRENVFRLRLLRAVQTRATSVFDYLAGPCSLPKDNDVQELSDLPLCRTLCTIIKAENADYLERAMAALIQQDISTDAMPTTRLMTLLSEMTGENRLERGAFTAATISFIDLVATQHICKENGASADGSLTHITPLLRVPPGSGTKPPLPQQRLTISTSASGQGGCQLVDKTWDYALRALTACREAYVEEYGALARCEAPHDSSGGHVTVHGGSAGGALTGVTSLDAAVGLRSLPGSVADVENQTRQLSRVMWEHAPAKQFKECKMASFYEYFDRSTNPFKTEVLENAHTVNACMSSAPYPLVLGPHFVFRNEKCERLCTVLNMLTSYMEVLTRLATSVRFAVVLRGTDCDSTAEDGSVLRNVEMLQVALEVLRETAYKTHPLLIFARQRCYATFLALASTLAQYIPPKSIEKDAFRPLVDFLVDFAQLNGTHLEVLNPTLAILLCFHDDLGRATGRLPAVFDLLNTVLHRHKVTPPDTEWDAFLVNVNHFFGQFGAYCTAPVYSTLPLLVRRAVELTDHIGVSECTSPLTAQFEALLATVIAVVRSDEQGRHFPHVPTAPIAALVHTLGAMRHSATACNSGAAGGAVAYQERAWHVLWNATLRFVLVFMTLEREFAPGDMIVKDHTTTSWLSSMTAVLSAAPRFLHALSGLTCPGTEALYCVWDFREIFVCTQLAVVMSSLSNPSCVFRVPVQTSFLQFLHYRPARLGKCVASAATPEAAQADERLMEEYMVLTVREQLSFFLLQAPLTATSDAAHPLLAFILREKAAERTADGGAPVRLSRKEYGCFFINTLVMLYSFIRQEHSYLRRAGAAGMTPSLAGPAGASLSEMPSRASFSRASSVTCTPRHTGISTSQRLAELNATDLNESVATDESFTPNTTAQESHARLQSVHVENTQLALSLYCVAVEELLSNQFSQSPLTTHEFYSDFIHCTKNLVRILKAMLADISGTGTPFFLTDYVTQVYVKLKQVLPSA
ncbi:hypothetical protein STCU_11260 [Strigomonas culicis]|uniref:Uncharacterized protein n=1 Tax=Strigomonas culicis TaxID=28005 RepID=S9THR2_9TRYP|nr:hypothetical protein STCU_11260 [Strigomonas culicis]|eukprot:EPY16444.1 hypothetical protein STCU_11260 [Strigomonas culicis]